MKYEKLNKNAMKCMFVSTLIQVLVLSIVFFVAWIIFKNSIPKIVETIMLGIILLDVTYLIVSPKLRFERYRYSITDDCIDVIEGFIFVKRNIVPIERLHKIAVEKGPIDRIFNLAKVIVTTAGGDVTIRFLDDEKSEFIATSLKNKINKIAKESRTEDKDDLSN